MSCCSAHVHLWAATRANIGREEVKTTVFHGRTQIDQISTLVSSSASVYATYVVTCPLHRNNYALKMRSRDREQA